MSVKDYFLKELVTEAVRQLPVEVWNPDWIPYLSPTSRDRMFSDGGLERYLSLLDPIVKETQGSYQLLYLKYNMVAIRMVCPSTLRVHVVRIPPHFSNLRLALRWVNQDIEEFTDQS